ncbi:hypothetical protein CSIRO_2601 [Bradyrhizobiaceae bacterium SG-6C]|nr:hypothetical protein CSIRO_2601 [Bradyrhizobiaceae bacterium SG-6C]
MRDSIRDFLVRGHRKVIEHYDRLLRSPSLPESERRLILGRRAKEEEALERLLKAVWTGRMAS